MLGKCIRMLVLFIFSLCIQSEYHARIVDLLRSPQCTHFQGIKVTLPLLEPLGRNPMMAPIVEVRHPQFKEEFQFKLVVLRIGLNHPL